MKAWVLFVSGLSYFVVLTAASLLEGPVPFSVLIFGVVLGCTILAGVGFRVARKSLERERYISDRAINKFGDPLQAKPSLPSRSSTRRDKLDA